MRFTFLVALLLIATPALADPAILTGDVTKVRDGAPITGVPRIVDGDSLVIGGVKIRLHGIDAPERNQTCGIEPNQWDCGRRSTRALSEMIDRAPVTCHERDVDRYGRIVAVCSVGGVLLNARMVAEGWAVSYRQYSMDYVGEEDQAREGGAEYGRASLSGQRTGVVGSGPANLVPHPTKTHATCLTGTAATSAHGRKHRASMRPLAQTTRTGLMVTAMGSRVRDCGASNPCSSSPRTHGRVSLLQRSRRGADFKDCN